MSFKRKMIVVGAAIVAFGGLFLTVRSCSAADQVAPAPTAAKVEKKTEAEVKQDLLDKVQAELAGVEKDLKQAETLTRKAELSHRIANLQSVLSMLQEQNESEEVQAAKDTRSYVKRAKDEFSDLVPVYAGNEVKPAGFGKAYSGAMFAASNEQAAIRTVKEAVIERLANAHTLAVLDQDVLHVPEYSALIKLSAQEAMDKDGIDTAAALAETLQLERLQDEAAIEELANPGFWQMAKWWWNS